MHGVEFVLLFVKNALNAGIDQHFQAMNAGSVGNVDVRVTDADAIFGCLSDGVDLRMDRAVAVLFHVAARRFGLID